MFELTSVWVSLATLAASSIFPAFDAPTRELCWPSSTAACEFCLPFHAKYIVPRPRTMVMTAWQTMLTVCGSNLGSVSAAHGELLLDHLLLHLGHRRLGHLLVQSRCALELGLNAGHLQKCQGEVPTTQLLVVEAEHQGMLLGVEHKAKLDQFFRIGLFGVGPSYFDSLAHDLLSPTLQVLA